jgi:hypothetical protein
VPARTNEFQDLITVLTQVLGEERATPSAMLIDAVTGQPREVDICVRGELAGHEVLIGIECRAWKAPQSVTWVEEMYGKHSHLPTSKHVLVSKSGFTKSALRFAAFHNIKAIVPGEVTSDFVGEIVNNLSSLWAKRFDFTTEKMTIVFEPPIKYADGYEADRMEAFNDLHIQLADGTVVCTAGDLMQSRLQNVDLDQPAFRDATGEENGFTSVDEYPHLDGKPLYLMSGDEGQPPDTLRKIVRVEINGTLKAVVAEVPLTHGDYDGVPYSTGTGVLGDQSMHWVVTEGPQGGRFATRVVPVGHTGSGQTHRGLLGQRSTEIAPE